MTFHVCSAIVLKGRGREGERKRERRRERVNEENEQQWSEMVDDFNASCASFSGQLAHAANVLVLHAHCVALSSG